MEVSFDAAGTDADVESGPVETGDRAEGFGADVEALQKVERFDDVFADDVPDPAGAADARRMELQHMVEGAEPVGSALWKDDAYHRGPTWVVDDIAEHGSHFDIVGGDGLERTLVQMPGGMNDEPGRFEWIVDGDGHLEHQMFVRGGTINGIPIEP